MTYYPLFKTTDAEIKGFENLDQSTLDNIFPIIELTKSRRTKKSPIGTIEKRVEKIKEILGDKPYVVDLTSEESLLNEEILQLYDYQNGYSYWCNYVSNTFEANIIPTINIRPDDVDGLEKNIKRQVSVLLNTQEKIALRLSIYEDLERYLKIVLSVCSPERVLLILDGGYIGQGRSQAYKEKLVKIINSAGKNLNNADQIEYIHLSSSFPSSVTSIGGNDERGEFTIEQISAHNALVKEIGDRFKISYGDFSSIHPKRYPTRGGTFVPRIDYPLVDKFIYHRYRRDDRGYVKAAEMMVRDPMFKNNKIECWGTREILKAADGNPGGLSPVHWIAVRENIHVTRQAANFPQD